MLSQCPQCHTIFHVSDTDVGARHGLVRCGHCRSIFHAVQNQVTGFEAESVTPEAEAEFPEPESEPAETRSEATQGPAEPTELEAELPKTEAEPEASESVTPEAEAEFPGPESEPAETRSEATQGPAEPTELEAELPKTEAEPQASESVTPEAEAEFPEPESQPAETRSEGAQSRTEPPEDGAERLEAAPTETGAQPPESVTGTREPGDVRREPDAASAGAGAVPEPMRHLEPVRPDDEQSVESMDTDTSPDPYAIPDNPDWLEHEAPASEDEPESEYPQVEEILIEAPTSMGFGLDTSIDEEEDADDRGSAASGQRADGSERENDTGMDARGRRAPPLSDASADTLEDAMTTPLESPYRARDIRMVELPQPQPFKTASLTLLAVLLGLLLIWQVRAFYLDELAQIPLFRPYLEQLCGPLGCSLPPRRDFARIELADTSISVNTEVPGALEIRAGLVNNAHFPQPYPPLRVTLTDREGRVVGRRTYLPDDYRPDAGQALLPIRERQDVTIDLAQPERNIVGYEVELVTPR